MLSATNKRVLSLIFELPISIEKVENIHRLHYALGLPASQTPNLKQSSCNG